MQLPGSFCRTAVLLHLPVLVLLRQLGARAVQPVAAAAVGHVTGHMLQQRLPACQDVNGDAARWHPASQ